MVAYQPFLGITMYVLSKKTIQILCSDILKSYPEDAETKALDLICTLSLKNETELLKLTKQLLGKSLYSFYCHLAIDKIKQSM